MELNADFTRAFPGGRSVEARFQMPLDGFGLTVLFGPSGCGKTTVLRCLAGLERPDRGRIQAGGEMWFHQDQGAGVPAECRGIGYVFQEPALFPHLTVAQNIAFGLRGWARAERQARVEELLALTGLEGFAGRWPGSISGGEKQRVALARALAPRPRLVLLDEPFAALDKVAAEQLRHSLRHLLQTLQAPALMVTHDPQEALALGDRMLLMADGRIIREGPPAALLSLPGDPARAQLGEVFRARVLDRVEGLLRLEVGSTQLFAPDPGGVGREVYACVRGEGVSLETGAHGRMSQRNHLSATVAGMVAQGALCRVQLDAGVPLEALITAWAWNDLQLAVGRPVQAVIKASAIQVIPIET
jgi:molybdate transport system ATP-binding protein